MKMLRWILSFGMFFTAHLTFGQDDGEAVVAFDTFTLSSGQPWMGWNAKAGVTYRVEKALNVSETWWTAPGTGSGELQSVRTASADGTLYYRDTSGLSNVFNYRVVADASLLVPEDMVAIPRNVHTGTNPGNEFNPLYPATYGLRTEALYMDKFEVDWSLWRSVYNWAGTRGYTFSGPGAGKGADHPVRDVTWYDCVKWCNARSEREGRNPCYWIDDAVYKSGDLQPRCDFSANGYRLPTNSEWEQGARGGKSDKRFPWGDHISHANANYKGEIELTYDFSDGYHSSYISGGMPYTSPVGSFAANGYGFYDMAGNVAEFCWGYEPEEHTSRGGSWFSSSELSRCGRLLYGSAGNNITGFRTVCRRAQMVVVPGGNNSGTDPDTGEAYLVSAQSFKMDRTDITMAQWNTVYDWAIANDYVFDNDGQAKELNHPVHTVSWHDCVKWCNARSEMEGLATYYKAFINGAYVTYKVGITDPSTIFGGNGYRLPTPMDWEYAARGGLRSKRFPWGNTISHYRANYYGISAVYDFDSSNGFHAMYDDDPLPYTSPAGSFFPNGYGLYDMSGNVLNWCAQGGSIRYVRGGSWVDNCRAILPPADLNISHAEKGNDIGFRTIRPIP